MQALRTCARRTWMPFLRVYDVRVYDFRRSVPRLQPVAILLITPSFGRRFAWRHATYNGASNTRARVPCYM